MHAAKEANNLSTSSNNGVGTLVLGEEGCEDEVDAIGEGDGALGRGEGVGKVIGECDRNAISEPECPLNFMRLRGAYCTSFTEGGSTQ